MQKKHEKKVGDASVQKMEGDTVRVILEHARVIPNPRRPRREALPMCTLRGAVWTTVHAAPAFFLHRQGRPPRSPAQISPAP